MYNQKLTCAQHRQGQLEWRDYFVGLHINDLMNLSGFCRNCLYKWLLAAAEDQGAQMSKDEAIQAVYGMTYAEWKANHQTKASDEQLQLFEDTKPLHSAISGH